MSAARMARELNVDGRRAALFPDERPDAPLVLLNGVEEEGERVAAEIRALTGAAFSLAAIGDLDWNDDLTPWPIPPFARGGTACAGLADRYIERLTGRMLPAIVAALPGAPAYVALAGYSLAGLFALYAPYRTDAFARVASASGSLWYPGFVEYAEERGWVRRPDRVYLSLGDREARSRNPLLKTVEDNTRRLAAMLAARGVESTFEMNPGGHFNMPERRMARGIAWLLE